MVGGYSYAGPYNPPTPRSTPRKRPRTSSVSNFSQRMADAFPQFARTVHAANAAARAVQNPTAANVVDAGVQAVKAYTSRHTQTKKRRKRGSSTAYTSGGKFSKRTKVDIFKKYQTRGVVNTKEVGGVVDGSTANPTYPVYIGHATHANTNTIIRMFCRSIIRDLFYKHGVTIQDMQNESPGNFLLQFRMVIRSPNDAYVGHNITSTGLSYIQCADNLYNFLNDPVTGLFNVTLSGKDANTCFYFVDATLFDTGAVTKFAQLELHDASVSCMVKSDLKIQNRTLANGTDDDINTTENVSNQPLYGKFYKGKGNGLVCKVVQTAQLNNKSLICSGLGILERNLAGVNDFWLREPPLPGTFLGRPQYGKVSIEPGTVKTSSLVNKFSIPQRKMWNMLILNQTNTTNFFGTIPQSRYGKYHIMAFEKMICATATDSPPVLGYELNQRHGLMLSYKRQRSSIEFIEDVSFIV